MREIVYRPAAVRDLDQVFGAIGAENPHRALHIVQEVNVDCRVLCDRPELGFVQDDFGPGIRVFSTRRGVTVAYRVTPAAIEITRVVSGAKTAP
jgi:plasmid stabilization system protein ParE